MSKKYNPELDVKHLSHIKENKKNAWFQKRYKDWKKQRVRRGFCAGDVWNLDNFLLNIIADTLDYFVKHHDGTPEGWSREDYDNYLIGIAKDLREANRLTSIDMCKVNEASNLLRSAFMRLSNVFWSLWD